MTLKFFLLTFALTWGGSAIVLRGDFGTPGSPQWVLRILILVAGTFAPSLVAIGLAAQEKGIAGVRALLRRMLDARVALRWYAFALGYMAAISFVVAVVERVSTGAWPAVNRDISYGVVIGMVIALPVQAGEEIGWRGYALPRLAAQFGFARASLILGLVWACWHLPMFYAPETRLYGQSFPVFAMAVVGISVAMTWLYVHTKRSLLLAILMHWAINQTGRIVPPRLSVPRNPLEFSRSPDEWIMVGLLSIAAAYFLVGLRKKQGVNESTGRATPSK